MVPRGESASADVPTWRSCAEQLSVSFGRLVFSSPPPLCSGLEELQTIRFACAMSRPISPPPALPTFPHNQNRNNAGLWKLNTIRTICLEKGWAGNPVVRAWHEYIADQLEGYFTGWEQARKRQLGREDTSMETLEVLEAAGTADNLQEAVDALVSHAGLPVRV